MRVCGKNNYYDYYYSTLCTATFVIKFIQMGSSRGVSNTLSTRCPREHVEKFVEHRSTRPLRHFHNVPAIEVAIVLGFVRPRIRDGDCVQLGGAVPSSGACGTVIKQVEPVLRATLPC